MKKTKERTPPRVGLLRRDVPVRYWFAESDQFHANMDDVLQAFDKAMVTEQPSHLWSTSYIQKPAESAIVYACIPIATLVRENGKINSKPV